MTPFDFINAINQTKVDLFKEPLANKDYDAYIVNRGLSYFHDTVVQANTMNQYSSLPNEWQFRFLLNSSLLFPLHIVVNLHLILRMSLYILYLVK